MPAIIGHGSFVRPTPTGSDGEAKQIYQERFVAHCFAHFSY